MGPDRTVCRRCKYLRLRIGGNRSTKMPHHCNWKNRIVNMQHCPTQCQCMLLTQKTSTPSQNTPPIRTPVNVQDTRSAFTTLSKSRTASIWLLPSSTNCFAIFSPSTLHGVCQCLFSKQHSLSFQEWSAWWKFQKMYLKNGNWKWIKNCLDPYPCSLDLALLRRTELCCSM